MRYVLFGTPRFGALVLEGLVKRGMLPVGIVTKPDRPTGRKQVMTPPAVKQMAEKLGLAVPVYQPEKLEDVYDSLRTLDADVFVVASFGKILKRELLDIPHRGTVGVHPSLLPKYRGTSPIQQVLLDGLGETGMSIFVVDAEVDHGPVIAKAKLPIEDDDDYFSLETKLSELGAELLEESLEAWIDGDLESVVQKHDWATFTRKFVTADAYVPWDDVAEAMQGDKEKAHDVRARIAAFNPEPGAWTERDGLRIKLLAAKVKDGKLEVTRYQKAGGTIQDVTLRI